MSSHILQLHSCETSAVGVNFLPFLHLLTELPSIMIFLLRTS